MDLTQFPTEFPKLLAAIQEGKKDLAQLFESPDYYKSEYLDKGKTLDDMLVDIFWEGVDVWFEDED